MTGSHQMPYPEYEDNNTAFFIGSMLPMVITISFSVVVPALIKRVVMEKESGIRVPPSRLNDDKEKRICCNHLSVSVCCIISIIRNC